MSKRDRKKLKLARMRSNILVTPDLARVTEDIFNALKIKCAGANPILFKKGGAIVQVLKNDLTDSLESRICTPQILRNVLSKEFDFKCYKSAEVETEAGFATRTTQAQTVAPTVVLENILAEADPPLPTLARILEVPVYGPNGELRTTPGFDHKSGYLYSPPPGFVMTPAPDRVTDQDVSWARALFDEDLLRDFPFEEQADRDNALSLVLTPIVRDMIAGPTPLHLVNGTKPGSGKDLLVKACVGIAAGANIGVITQPRDDSELEKKVTAEMVKGCEALVISNVWRYLDSPSLCVLTTEPFWCGRILGESRTLRERVRQTICVTGNNVTATSEITRRSVLIRLVPKVAHPEERDDFKHPDLLGWARKHRGDLLRAAYILVSWWLQSGSPSPPIKPLGSFEEWTRVVGGILYAAGYDKFLTNRKKLQSASDLESQVLAAFCAAVWDNEEKIVDSKFVERVVGFRFRDRKATTAELLEVAEDVDGLPLWGSTPKGRQTSLGKYLGRHVESIVEETDDNGEVIRRFTIKKAGMKSGSQLWQIVLLRD